MKSCLFFYLFTQNKNLIALVSISLYGFVLFTNRLEMYMQYTSLILSGAYESLREESLILNRYVCKFWKLKYFKEYQMLINVSLHFRIFLNPNIYLTHWH